MPFMSSFIPNTPWTICGHLPCPVEYVCKSHEPQVPWRDATMKRGHIETGYHHQPHLQGRMAVRNHTLAISCYFFRKCTPPKTNMTMDKHVFLFYCNVSPISKKIKFSISMGVFG